MLVNEINIVQNIWNDVVEHHKGSFNFSTKCGGKYKVCNQYGKFNIYSSHNKLVVDNISNIEDLTNCMVMLGYSL